MFIPITGCHTAADLVIKTHHPFCPISVITKSSLLCLLPGFSQGRLSVKPCDLHLGKCEAQRPPNWFRLHLPAAHPLDHFPPPHPLHQLPPPPIILPTPHLPHHPSHTPPSPSPFPITPHLYPTLLITLPKLKLCPHQTLSPYCPSPSPFTFCLYEFDYPEYFIQMESFIFYGIIYLFVTGLFHLEECLQGPPMWWHMSEYSPFLRQIIFHGAFPGG